MRMKAEEGDQAGGSCKTSPHRGFPTRLTYLTYLISALI